MNHPQALPLPTVAEILARFNYCPNTGIWTFARVVANRKAGTRAGRKSKGGYRELSFNGRNYSEHRMAWKVFYGTDPASHIDHINGDKTDNRISNLRLATPGQNAANRIAPTTSRTGYRGVSKMANKYGAYVSFGGRKVWVGLFATPQEAHAAYYAKKRQLFGEFAAP